MKECIPRTTDRIITVLAAVVCAIGAFFAFRELLNGGQPPVVFFGMGLLFGGITIHTISMGRTSKRKDEHILPLLSCRMVFLLSG